MRHPFEMVVLKSGGRACSISTHCDTGFGSQYIVALSISKHIDSLVAMCGSAPFLQLLREGRESAVKLHAILVVKYTHQDGFVRRLPILAKVCEPIYASMLAVEADKAYLSTTRLLVKKLETHAQWFYQTHGDLCDGFIQRFERNLGLQIII
jgi:hypothetical protein